MTEEMDRAREIARSYVGLSWQIGHMTDLVYTRIVPISPTTEEAAAARRIARAAASSVLGE